MQTKIRDFWTKIMGGLELTFCTVCKTNICISTEIRRRRKIYKCNIKINFWIIKGKKGFPMWEQKYIYVFGRHCFLFHSQRKKRILQLNETFS